MEWGTPPQGRSAARQNGTVKQTKNFSPFLIQNPPSQMLSEFSMGMSKSMKKVFNFVNVEGGVYHDITKTMINIPYTAPANAA